MTCFPVSLTQLRKCSHPLRGSLWFSTEQTHSKNTSDKNISAAINTHLFCEPSEDRAATISRLIHSSIKRELIDSYREKNLIVSVIFQVQMPNIYWLQLLRRQNFLLVFVIFNI